jgi:hypothetical protein
MTYSSLSMSSGSSWRSPRASVQSSPASGQRYGGRGLNAVDFRKGGGRLGPVTNTVILIVLACLLGLLYLTQVTKTDTYGYQIDKLQTQAGELKQENENLELASAQMQSLERVEASPQATALAPVTPSGTVKQ